MRQELCGIKQERDELRQENQELIGDIQKLKDELEALRLQDPEAKWNNTVKSPIIGRTYRNERVELDGFSYSNCKFIHVTFVFRGEKPFDLAHNSIEGPYNIDAPSERLQMFLILLRALNYLNPEAEIYGPDGEREGRPDNPEPDKP